MNTSNLKIDAVITWVNGDDPLHMTKLNSHLKSLGFKPKSASETRFKSMNEIFYTVKSIIIFAPYIKNIYVVTDQQDPEFYSSGMFNESELEIVKIIDHSVIFKGYESYIPTFNSITIANMLFRIPDLSEHFIYFNDDVLLVRNTNPETFFSNGHPIIRGNFTIIPEEKFIKKIQSKLYDVISIMPNKQNKDSFTLAQSKSAKIIGFEKHYLRIGHTPHPLRKSTFTDFYQKNPELLIQNIKHKLRHADQYSAISLANHVEIKLNQCKIQKNLNCIYIKPYKGFFLESRIEKLSKRKDKFFACIQSLDRASKLRQKIIFRWLQKIILSQAAKKPA